MKRILGVFLLSTLICGLLLVDGSFTGRVLASTSENGIITQNTTWTKANSPYIFTGPVGVAKGATLTIEPGVTVDIGTFYLEVNGTLNAQGSAADQIFFNSNNPYAGPPNNYNMLSNSPDNIFLGYEYPTCNIENAILNQTSINGDSYISNATVTLIGCSLKGDSEISVGGFTTIDNSFIEGAVLLRGASTVTGNTFLGGINIAGGKYTAAGVGTYLFSGNNITNQQGNDVIIAGDSGTISGNVIWGGSDAGIRHSGYQTGMTIIEKNLVTNNYWGILIDRADGNSTIQDNTIINNVMGISKPTPLQIITGNNIQNNSQYNIQASSTGVTVSNNYWGTIDQSIISNSIYDSKYDFNLGTVTFTPFLTSPNTQATPPNTQFPTLNPTSPMPTQTTLPTETTSSQNPTATATEHSGPGITQPFNWAEIGIFALLAIIAVLLVAILVNVRKRK